MRKQLILVFAICVLFLSACGSLVATSTSSGVSTTHSSASITTASAQSVCHVLRERQAQLSQQYHAASVQFNAARTRGNSLQAQDAEKTLIRLHQALTQVQSQLKAC